MVQEISTNTKAKHDMEHNPTRKGAVKAPLKATSLTLHIRSKLLGG